MSTSANPLAAGVPALQPPKTTQAMISPDGQSVADIPVERVQDAIKGGYKMGVDMHAPDGSTATIPVDRAHDAVTKGGYRPAGQTPAAGQAMETSIAPKIVRGITGALPVVGAIGGAAMASPGMVTTPAGAGLGAAAGETARQGINREIFGNEEVSPTSKEGLISTAEQGAGGVAGEMGGQIIGKTLEAAPSVVSKIGEGYDAVKNAVKFNPEELHAGIQKVAEDAGGATTTSARKSFEQAGDAVYAKSKDLYAEIDQATGNKWSANETELKNVNDELRDTLGVDTAKDSKLLITKQRLEMQQDQMIDNMEAAGVPRETVDAAKANYKKAQALYDVDSAIKSTTPIGKETAATMKRPEQVDPKRLLPKLQKLYDTGRLQQALGEDGSQNLLAKVEDADLHARVAARNAKRVGAAAGYAAKSALGAGGVYGLYELAKH